MDTTRVVKLELVRPGPPHNQLLSPLTNYVALCGAAAPSTFSVPVEHRVLLQELRALTGDPDPGRRRAQLERLAERAEGIFASIDAFASEIGAARSAAAHSGLIHLRLVITPSELAIIPFEAANIPAGLRGEKQSLALQQLTRVCITREIRDCEAPAPGWWALRPRILVVAASPPGFAEVPLRAHLLALRRALAPWLVAGGGEARPERNDGTYEPQPFDAVVTLLPNASLDAIQRACARDRFTHIHVLAHGAELPENHEQRFGIALHHDDNVTQLRVVSGHELALALRTQSVDGVTVSSPLQVTLATCDSANVGSVVVPGASVAHALHAGGIPWVFASQFPLSFAGSALVTQELYERLLRGDDPRQVLHALRQKLRLSCDETNDWASLVCYAAMGADFERDWARFRHRQTHRAVDAAFSILDDMLAQSGPQVRAQGEAQLGRVAACTEQFKAVAEDSALRGDVGQRSEALGMMASNQKRSAEFRYRLLDLDAARAALGKARDLYREALSADVRSHWVVSQYVTLCLPVAGAIPEDWWYVAHASATLDLEQLDPKQVAWAHGTLAELYLLAMSSEPLRAAFPRAEPHALEHAKALVRLRGLESFQTTSTRRQLERYPRWWLPEAALRRDDGPDNEQLAAMGKAAQKLIKVLRKP
jgi:hypothetical protein